MKDARTKKIQKRMEPLSPLGLGTFAATTATGATALALTARSTPFGMALVNATLPTLLSLCEYGLIADLGVATVFKLITTAPARSRCKTTVKNIGKVQQIKRVVKPQSEEDKNAQREYRDYLDKLKGLQGVSDENLTPILRSIYYDNPNRLEQDVLNNLSFRDLTGDYAVKVGGKVVFDGAKLNPNLDYGLSTVHNVVRLRMLLEEAKESFGDTKGKEDEVLELDKLAGNGAAAEHTKILKQLGHVGITSESLLTLSEVNKIIAGINKYLEPLDVLKEDLGDGKKGIFLEAYRLRGKKFQHFGNLFRDGQVGNKMVEQLIAAHAATMDKEDGAEFVATMEEKAANVNRDIDELGLGDDQVVGLRKKMKKNREYKLDIKLNKDQRALLTREYYLKRNKELNAHFKNGFVTLDWVKDVLTTGVELNSRILKNQYKLALQICEIAGIAKSKLKQAIKEGTLENLLAKPELANTVEKIAKGIDFASLDGSGNKGFEAQYLVTNKYKLKKFKSRRKALKKVYKSLPEYKKVAKRHQIMPMTRFIFKKIGVGTIAGLTLGAGLLGAAVLSGLGIAGAALGIAGVAVAGVTAASKIHEMRTGKKFFRVKTDAYEDKEEYAEWKKQNPSKNFAPSKSITTPRFRNKVVAMSENPIKQIGKRFFNAIGWSSFGKPKADEIEFGVPTDGSPTFEYPRSLISAYEVDGVLDEAKPGISAAIKKAVMRGLRHNSEVNFLVDPIEVYIRDKKGKVKAAVHVDQKSLAKNVLGVLLENYGASSDTTFDVNIGKTRFVVQPSEVIDKDSGAVDKDRIHATVKRITGYAREEEFRRTIPELYADIYRHPDAFGIELDEDGAVVGNHGLAQSVNYNATRFGDGEQLYKKFKFSPVKKQKAKKEEKPAQAVNNEVVDDEEELDDAEGLVAGDVDYDEEVEGVVRTKPQRVVASSLEEALYIWAHDPENLRRYQLARDYFDDFLYTKNKKSEPVVDEDAVLPKEAKQLKAIAERLGGLQQRVTAIANNESAVDHKDDYEKIIIGLAAVSEEIKPLVSAEGSVDPKTLDADKLTTINGKLDVSEAAIEDLENKLVKKPAEEVVAPATEVVEEPVTKTDAMIKDILAKLEDLTKVVNGLKGGTADPVVNEEEPAVEEVVAGDVNKALAELVDAASKVNRRATSNSVQDARDKVIEAIKTSSKDIKGAVESVEKLLSVGLPEDQIDKIVHEITEWLPKAVGLSKQQQSQIGNVFRTVQNISHNVKLVHEDFASISSALEQNKEGSSKAVDQILEAIRGIKPGESVNADKLLDDLKTAVIDAVNGIETGDSWSVADKNKVLWSVNQLFGKGREKGAIQTIQSDIEKIQTTLDEGVGVSSEGIQAVVKHTIVSGFEENDDHKYGWLGGNIAKVLANVAVTAKFSDTTIDEIAARILKDMPDGIKPYSDVANSQRIANLITVYIHSHSQTPDTYKDLRKTLNRVYGLDEEQIDDVLKKHNVTAPIEKIVPVRPKKQKLPPEQQAVKNYFEAFDKNIGFDLTDPNGSLKDRAVKRLNELVAIVEDSEARLAKRISDLKTKFSGLDAAASACEGEVILLREILYGINIVPDTKVQGPAQKVMINKLLEAIRDKTIDINKVVDDLKERLASCNVTQKAIDAIFYYKKYANERDLNILLSLPTSYVDGQIQNQDKAKQLVKEIAQINTERLNVKNATHV